MEKLSLLLKDQILEEVCVVEKESRDRFTVPLARSVTLQLFKAADQPSRRPRDTGMYVCIGGGGGSETDSSQESGWLWGWTWEGF